MLSPNTLLHTIDTFKMIRAQHLQFQQETVLFFAMNLQCLHTNVLSFFLFFVTSICLCLRKHKNFEEVYNGLNLGL